MPLDVRGIYGTGATTLALINTLAISDGASVAGMPLKGDKDRGTPILLGWGFQNVIADTHRELQLLDADQFDARTGEYDLLGTASLVNARHYWTRIPFRGGVRSTSIRSNTAAGLPIAYTMDEYPGAYPTVRCSEISGPTQKLSQVFGGALTAQTTWGNVGVAPTPPLKAGRYAILGAIVNALTDNAVLRFAHADFNGYRPGFPVTDETNVAVARANVTPDLLTGYQGYQFVFMDQLLGTGCPVFTAASTASGLTIECLDTTANTPNVLLNLAVVG